MKMGVCGMIFLLDYVLRKGLPNLVMVVVVTTKKAVGSTIPFSQIVDTLIIVSENAEIPIGVKELNTKIQDVNYGKLHRMGEVLVAVEHAG